MKRPKPLYEKETNWGTHEVTDGFGKHTGKYLAQSHGWGGARGYFRVFATLAEAREHVDRQTRPLDPKDVIAF